MRRTSTRPRPPSTVYRLYDSAGALLYVGCSSQPQRRIRVHRSSAPFGALIARVEVDHGLIPHADALAEEARQIHALRPRHNREWNRAGESRRPAAPHRQAVVVGELSTAEVADLLGYEWPSTVHGLVRAGRLTPVRKLPGASGAYLFRKSEVDRFIRARRRPDASK